MTKNISVLILTCSECAISIGCLVSLNTRNALSAFLRIWSLFFWIIIFDLLTVHPQLRVYLVIVPWILPSGLFGPHNVLRIRVLSCVMSCHQSIYPNVPFSKIFLGKASWVPSIPWRFRSLPPEVSNGAMHLTYITADFSPLPGGLVSWSLYFKAHVEIFWTVWGPCKMSISLYLVLPFSASALDTNQYYHQWTNQGQHACGITTYNFYTYLCWKSTPMQTLYKLWC